MTSRSHGPKNINIRPTINIFGMKVSVASLICVIAWNTLIRRPTTRAEMSIGEAIIAVVFNAVLPRCKIKSSFIVVYPKLLTMEPIKRLQPSTKTKSIILNGKETTTGGNIIIPMAINTLAVTISMTRNGKKMMNPI